MSPDSLSVVNPAVAVPPSAYVNALDEYVDRASNVPGIVSILQMGSAKAPGLSDLDVVVVVRDDFDRAFGHRLSTHGIDSNLFTHGPVIVPERLAPSLNYIIYASQLDSLLGPDGLPRFDDLSDHDAKGLASAYLIDFLESRLMQIADAEHSLQIDHRKWMTRLWSLTHSMDLGQRLGHDPGIAATKVIDRIRRMRVEWLANHETNEDEFVETFRDGADLTRKMFTEAVLNLHGERARILAHGRNTSGVVIGRKIFHFDPDCQVPHCQPTSVRLLGRTFRAYKCTYHTSMWLHLRNYGLLGSGSAKSHVSTGEFSDVLSKRGELVRSHWRWLHKHCRRTGSMAGYICAQPSHPWSARHMVDSVATAAARLRGATFRL